MEQIKREITAEEVQSVQLQQELDSLQSQIDQDIPLDVSVYFTSHNRSLTLSLFSFVGAEFYDWSDKSPVGFKRGVIKSVSSNRIKTITITETNSQEYYTNLIWGLTLH